jgi:uncharacterized protein YacL
MRVSTSLLLLLRTCAGLLFGLLGWSIASAIPAADLPAPLNNDILLRVAFTLIFGIIAIAVSPRLLTRPVNSFIDRLSRASGTQIFADFLGFLMGLLVAALLAFPLSLLPEPFRQVLPLLAVVVFAYLGVLIMNTHYRELFSMINLRTPSNRTEEPVTLTPRSNGKDPLLLDTSVIIDGRIVDVSETGFLRGELVVPRFVLNELHHIADASDGMRRARGRRGLEVLKRLQKESRAQVKIVDDDPGTTKEVDEKLVLLAKQWQCPIVTNDYNLNKVATLQGVAVLNVNELANAVKSALLPGENLTLRVIQEGKEAGQGVGYLDDGTMVVVEEGRSYLNQTINVTVTKVLQTAAGRMIFAKP